MPCPAVFRAVPRSCPIFLRLSRSSDMELEKSMRIYRSMGLSRGSNTCSSKCRSSPGRSRTRSPWGDTWLRCRVVSICVSCVQGRGTPGWRVSPDLMEIPLSSARGHDSLPQTASLELGGPSPLDPHSGHLCDLEAALHDHHALLPAARSQQLCLGVAAPFLEHLAGRRWSQEGSALPLAVLTLDLPSPPTTPIFLTLACSPTTAWPEAGLRAGQVGARAQGWGVAGWGTQVGKVASHLIRAVGAVLVHADALGAALHLGLLAAVRWGAEMGVPTEMRLTHCQALPLCILI